MKQALLLVDHGSVRKEANDMLAEVASLVEKARPNLIVEIAHMELSLPTIAEGFSRCISRGAEEIIVHPYMLAPGRHATEDIPRMVQEAAANYPSIAYRVSEPLGVDELIAQVVLRRVNL